MIWTINDISAFRSAFVAAGEPDQSIINAYLAKKRRTMQPQARPGVRRYYYLLAEDPRVSLCCVGMPLADWNGGGHVQGGHTGNRRGICGQSTHSRA